MSNDDGPSPLAIALIIAVCLGALVFLAWFFHFLGWGLHEDSVNRNDRVNRESYGFQQSARETLGNGISTINGIDVQIAGATTTQAQTLAAQRWGIVNQTCNTAAQINDPTTLPTDQQSWVAENCSAGAGRPGSKYAPST
jgi:hypothetical protein